MYSFEYNTLSKPSCNSNIPPHVAFDIIFEKIVSVVSVPRPEQYAVSFDRNEKVENSFIASPFIQ